MVRVLNILFSKNSPQKLKIEIPTMSSTFAFRLFNPHAKVKTMKIPRPSTHTPALPRSKPSRAQADIFRICLTNCHIVQPHTTPKRTRQCRTVTHGSPNTCVWAIAVNREMENNVSLCDTILIMDLHGWIT